MSDDRRDHGPYLAMLESFKRDIYEHMDRGFEDVKERIQSSHQENRGWQMQHAGPSADSMHGQEAAKRGRHYAEHDELKEKVIDPLIRRVDHHQWKLTAMIIGIGGAAGLLSAWLKGAIAKVFGGP